MTRTCSVCKRDLPLTAYRKRAQSADGLDYGCRECRSKTTAAWHGRQREKNRHTEIDPNGLSHCGHCKQDLPNRRFARSAHTKSGLFGWCMRCQGEARKTRNRLARTKPSELQ